MPYGPDGDLSGAGAPGGEVPGGALKSALDVGERSERLLMASVTLAPLSPQCQTDQQESHWRTRSRKRLWVRPVALVFTRPPIGSAVNQLCPLSGSQDRIDLVLGANA